MVDFNRKIKDKTNQVFVADQEGIIDKQPSIHETLSLISNLYSGSDESGRSAFEHPYRIFRFLPKIERTESDTPEAWQEKLKEIKNLHLVALLHDAVEDKKISIDELKAKGYSEEVIEAVSILSRPKYDKSLPQEIKNKLYREWVNDTVLASGNKYAIIIKYMDVLDNISPPRMKFSGSEERVMEEREKRYGKYGGVFKELAHEANKIIKEKTDWIWSEVSKVLINKAYKVLDEKGIIYS